MWVLWHGFFRKALRQHLSIRCNLVPKVFRLHLLVPTRRTVGRLQVKACRHGLVPMGGMTYVLGTSTLFNQAANHQITVDGSEILRSKTSWGNSIWHPLFCGSRVKTTIQPGGKKPWDFWLASNTVGGEVSILAMAPWWISSSYSLASSWSWLGVFGSLGVSWMSWDMMITNYENGTWISWLYDIGF